MRQAFLSYAHLNKAEAKRLHADLSCSDTVRIWFDEIDLLPGMKLTPATRKAIRESRYFIALMSKESVSRRGFRNSELRRALEILDEFPDDKIYLIPARIDKCKPPDERMEDILCADLFPDWVDGVDRMKKSLRIPTSSSPTQVSSRQKQTKPRPVKSSKSTRPHPTDYHYRTRLVTLDTQIPQLRAVARGLNSVQLFFWFQVSSAHPSRRALRRIDDYPQLDVDKLSKIFYNRIVPANADYVNCLTDRYLAFAEDARQFHNYLSVSSIEDERVMFTSVGGLDEYAEEAGVTMQVALAYTLVSWIASYFLDLEYHDELRGCPMDFTEDHADMVKGLKRGKFCRSCAPRVRKNKPLEQAIKRMLAWGRE